VYRSGRRYDGTFLQLVAVPAEAWPGRVGYVLGRRVMPRAVDRNRLRRRLREAVQAARPAIAGLDVILRLRIATPRTQIGAAALEARALIARALGAA
jgi:ribonuclease P protein component